MDNQNLKYPGNQKELKFREWGQGVIDKLIARDIKLIAEIRANASREKDNISFNDISDLKIDLETLGA